MVILVLFILGLFFGSFINALIFRLHKQQSLKSKKDKEKYSISRGRSMCVHCGHQLSPADLIPVISWVVLKGKCRYCKKPISIQYPVVELLTAFLFSLSYAFWSDEVLSGSNIVLFIGWELSLIGLVALLVYDLRYLILPNKIILPVILTAAISVITYSVLENTYEPIVSSAYGLLIGGGIFYLLFQISSGKWIGGGDVKLGFALGILVGGPSLALLMLFLASLLGTLYSLPLIANRELQARSKIAFGPFLIVAAIIVRLWGSDIVDWYSGLFL